jgi:hypothetical protein
VTKPPIDPVRWQPPPSRALPEPDMTAPLNVVALPGNAPEDVVVDADGNIWTDVDDGDASSGSLPTAAPRKWSPTLAGGRWA